MESDIVRLAADKSNEAIYGIDGRKISHSLHKGVYIKNQQKVVLK